MKILYITVRADFGGGPRHVAQLINNLATKYEIYVATPYGNPYGTEWRNNKNIKGVLTIPYRSFSLRTFFELKNYIQINDIKIIHSHGNGAGLYSRLLKFLYPRIKIIHTFHGITDNYNSLYKYIANIITGKVLKYLTNTFILVSNGEKELGTKLGFINLEKSYVIYNGIKDSGEKQKNNNQTINIVTLSRFDYQKNMDMAFSIAQHFKEDKHINFTWIGDGENFQRLKEEAIKEKINIKFVGFSNEPIKYLKEADIYLSTSRFEGLPYALIEAASVGLPIIATNVIGNNECVKNHETGLLFNTVEEGISCIKQLKDNTIRKEMGYKSRQFFLENFTIEKMVNRLISIYECI